MTYIVLQFASTSSCEEASSHLSLMTLLLWVSCAFKDLNGVLNKLSSQSLDILLTLNLAENLSLFLPPRSKNVGIRRMTESRLWI
jgi:hypothetical protein